MSNTPTAAIWTLVLLAKLILNPVDAYAASPGEMQTGSLLMRMSEGYETATLLNTDVNIDVNGLVARVSVMQEFRNEGTEWVEGIYVFPLPDEAAVDHMRMYVGERFIEGEIREKEQARKEYEQAKRQGKKTGLVEPGPDPRHLCDAAHLEGSEVTVLLEELDLLGRQAVITGVCRRCVRHCHSPLTRRVGLPATPSCSCYSSPPGRRCCSKNCQISSLASMS